MAKKNNKTNPQLITLINELKKHSKEKDIPLWKDIALRLEKSSKNRPTVDLNKINKYVDNKETALIAGKVLSTGNLDKKITIAAWSFSEKATEKIKKAGGKPITIMELMKDNPEGKNIRIMG